MTQPRTTIRRHPERTLAVPDDAAAILAAATVAHVGFVQDGQPYVIPFTFLYQDGTIYLHGAHGSRAVKALASGAPVCVEVTLMDGLIASKTAESHSVNYRSVVAFGRGHQVRDEDAARAIFYTLIGRYFPGRSAGAHYAHLTEKEMKAVALIAVEVEELRAKGRFGGPLGPFDADPTVPGIAGVFPVSGAGAAG